MCCPCAFRIFVLINNKENIVEVKRKKYAGELDVHVLTSIHMYEINVRMNSYPPHSAFLRKRAYALLQFFNFLSLENSAGIPKASCLFY